MKKTASALLACATTFGAAFQVCCCMPAALAKMTHAQDEQYEEMVQAGAALYKSKNLEGAKAKYNEALQEATGGDDKKKQARAMLWLGVIYQSQKDYAQSEKILKEAVALADANAEVGDVEQSQCLLELSRTLIADQKAQEAKPYFTRCIELSRKIYSLNHPTLATRTLEYAKLLTYLGETDVAARLTEQSQYQINEFMRDAATKIKKAWQPPPENFSYRLAVLYSILEHGKLGNVEITQSSGSPTSDKAAIDAVKTAQPFADIESKNAGESVDMIFNFDYNYNASKRSANERNSRMQSQRHQTKEVQAETEAKLKEERTKSAALKEQIDNFKSDKSNQAQFVNLYDQYAQSLITQGLYTDAVNFLKQGLSRSECQDIHGVPALSLTADLGHAYMGAKTLGSADETLKLVIEDKNFSKLSTALKIQALTDYGNFLSKAGKFAEAQDYFGRASDLKNE